MNRVYIQPDASADTAQAAGWYEAQRPGLGIEFVLEVDAAIERACFDPESCAILFRNVRRALLRRFPYAVYFVLQNGSIEIFAILSQKRNPVLWQARAPSS